MDSAKTSIKSFTREELESHATEDGNVVYEWEYDTPTKTMTPVERATAFQEIRDEYLRFRRDAPGMEDDAIRDAIQQAGHPIIRDFAETTTTLFERITDRTTTEDMIENYKFMIVMRQKIEAGEFTEEGATSIVKDRVDKTTVREATAEEIATGKVQSKMWEGNPLTRAEREARAAQGRVATDAESVTLDPARMRTVERRSAAQVSRAEVKDAVKGVMGATNSIGLKTSLRKLQRLLNKTSDGVPVDVEGLDRAFRMKQVSARGVWDRDVTDLVGRIMRIAKEKAKGAPQAGGRGAGVGAGSGSGGGES